MIKTFVLDTNVLLHNSSCIESFADNTVVLPMAVIEELDRFKGRHDEKGRNARQVIRRLDQLRKLGHLGDGVPMENGGTLRIITGRDASLDPGLDKELVDNKIIRLAYNLKHSGQRVIFVSKDINARLKSDALGIETMDFEKQMVNFDELYNGFKQLELDELQWHNLKNKGRLQLEIEAMPNEFAVFANNAPNAQAVLARHQGSGVFSPLTNQNVAWNIKPRSLEQQMALELLLDDRLPLVTLVGGAGTGKTLLALAAGMELTAKNKRYDKILVSRPIMPLGKDIGFLPGDKDSKLQNWMQPIFDNLAFLMRSSGDSKLSVRERIERLQRDRVIELEALTYIRGRSIPRQYVIIDEAQNLTPHEVKTIISRAGEDTKMILTGDPSQIDNPYLDSNSNGLTYTVERMKFLPLHGHVTLKKSERSELAAAAADRL